MHPLAESDPAERTPARNETPAAEAADWLQNPTDDASREPSANERLIDLWTNGPQWTGPPLSEQSDDTEGLS